MAKQKEIVYVVHPISYEQKLSFVNKGLKIIDARFAPKGAAVENPNANPEKVVAKK